MRPLRIGALLFTLLLWAAASSAQYQVQSWTTENGLPQNVGRAVHQTRDGYLWVATLDGLVRFDGVRFTVFNRANTPGMRSNRFNSLYEAADGAIWAGTDDAGVTRHHQGTFTTFGIQEGLPDNAVGSVTGDATGNVWLLSAQKIMRWDGARFSPADLQGLTLAFTGSAWNPTLFWACDGHKVYRFAEGRVTERLLPAAIQGSLYYRFEEEASGALWVATDGGRIARISGEEVRVDRIPELRADVPELETTFRDRSGRLWPVMVSRALNRYWRLPDAPDTPVPFSSVVEDREGNIWLGTQGKGLYRIRQARVTMYSRAQGLIGWNIYPVLADRAGNVWMGAWPSGLSRVTNGRVVNYTVADGLSSGLVTSLAEDRQGRLWVAAYGDRNGGLRIFEGGRFRDPGRTLLPQSGEVRAIVHDRSGDTWIGTTAGLVREHGGVVTLFTTRDGLAGNDVKTIIEDQDGRIWIGSDGGLTSWHGGALTSWTARDGLPAGVVRSLYRDPEGVLWIGTYDSGLGRLKDGRFSRFTTRQGLFDDGVFQILEDRRGYLWMTSNRGIHRASKRELNAVADGTANRITALSLGKGDGLLNAECNGGSWPSGAIGPNGTMWFPTQDGVAVLDPETFTAASLPVPPRIESVLVDRLPVPSEGPIRIVPGQADLEIQYTGLSLVNSERIRFRYRLAGLDHDWVDVGTRRTAYYSHIPPGTYTFSVMAAGSDGGWTTDVATLPIRVIPPFWRTWWFALVTGATLVGAAGFGYHHRVTTLEAARAAQERFARQLIDSQERERRRIAAELHASLGQNLLVIKNRALFGLLQPDDAPRAAEQLTDISTTVSQAIDEVRQIAANLHPYQLDRLGLTKALAAVVRNVGSAAQLDVACAVDDVDGLLTPAAESHLYRIVQECLNNIVKHAGATEVSVTLRREAHRLLLTIRDNGRGFVPGSVPAGHDGQGGLGLAGMSERALLLHGALTIDSTPGAGSRIVLTMPVPLREQA